MSHWLENVKKEGENDVKNLLWIAYTVDHEVHNGLWH